MSGAQPAMLETYFRMMNTNGVAQTYAAALEAGVLAALEKRPLTADELAAACDTHLRPTELLLTALAAMGIVRHEQDKYALTGVARLLLGSQYRELGNQYWRHLPRFLQSGVPIQKMDDVSQSESHYQSQAALLGWMLTPAAETAANILHARNDERALKILDVGAGSAVWSLNLARLHERSHVTAVDWPAVLEVAVETAAEYGMATRLTKLPGDCHQLAFPNGAYDLAIVANLTHLLPPEQNASLFQKIHASLQPGGTLVIIDAFASSPVGDVPLALYQLGLALRTENGHVYSPEQLQSMFGDQFSPGELVPLDVPPHVVGMMLCERQNGIA